MGELYSRTPADCARWSRIPDALASSHAPELRQRLHQLGISADEFTDWVRAAPFVHLQKVFPADRLPDTPEVWYPVPESPSTITAAMSMILLASLAGMEAVSYGAENDGSLFVNLVALPGQGVLQERSRTPMRGHTDAASFPFRGTLDTDDERIAPSPDIVFLAAMRNPNAVATTVRAIDEVLDQLSSHQIDLLKGPHWVLNAQKSFQRGTLQALGYEHQADGVPILLETSEGLWVRYSHRESTVADQDDRPARDTKDAFEAACANTGVEIALAPGDVLLVNNRKALHGRSPVGAETGGQSRWLVRGYGLDCNGLQPERRYASPRHKLFP